MFALIHITILVYYAFSCGVFVDALFGHPVLPNSGHKIHFIYFVAGKRTGIEIKHNRVEWGRQIAIYAERHPHKNIIHPLAPKDNVIESTTRTVEQMQNSLFCPIPTGLFIMMVGLCC